ncbi:alpha/beta-Hydrolases superfamily protein [Tasmannia lanceolata]|uniref:alpha/beta-Hydrolases superfamily protein n=1 Tax=Tasmannia lanceolata TaxID=3420 RepID=UPI00406317E5
MAKQSPVRLFHRLDWSINLIKKQECYQRFVSSILTHSRMQWSKTEKVEIDDSRMGKDGSCGLLEPERKEQRNQGAGLSKYSTQDDNLSDKKWKVELAWLTKALEPALQLCRRALPTGNNDKENIPPSGRSIAEILGGLQRSKIGIQDWSLSDVTVGLYLIYLRQASANKVEDVMGVPISSEYIVQDLIYHSELAKGSYKENTASLARNCMLRESNILKFVKNSSVMRPGYYIGADIRNKLIILGIRGTHTVYDLITDMVSSSDKEVTFDGFSTHFGTAEAARWFLHHEMGTIRKCLEKHEGFRLRLVGHSLGGAAAALLAIMLRKKTKEELGFSPDIVSAVGFGTPPCVSKELAESCANYVSTVVLQDDIIPRLSIASLTRLRNEILQTDWMSVLEKEDCKSITDFLTNAKQVVSSVQDVARRVADYAKIRNKTNSSELSITNESGVVENPLPKPLSKDSAIVKQDGAAPEELFTPGTLYFLKRRQDACNGGGKGKEFYTLWKRHAGEHFQTIVLSSNLISDHQCDNHFYALRDVLKGLPGSIVR